MEFVVVDHDPTRNVIRRVRCDVAMSFPYFLNKLHQNKPLAFYLVSMATSNLLEQTLQQFKFIMESHP